MTNSGGHPSRTNVTICLKRPNPEERRATLCLPYLALLLVRFAKPACHQAAGELLPRHFTLTRFLSS